MEVVLDVWNAGNVRFWLHLLVTIFVGVIIWQRVYIEISCMDLCFLLGPPVAPNLCQFVSSKTAILIRSVPNQLASIVVQGLVQIHYLQYSDMEGEQNNATELRDGYPQILQSSFQLWKPLHCVESNIHGLTDVNQNLWIFTVTEPILCHCRLVVHNHGYSVRKGTNLKLNSATSASGSWPTIGDLGATWGHRLVCTTSNWRFGGLHVLFQPFVLQFTITNTKQILVFQCAETKQLIFLYVGFRSFRKQKNKSRGQQKKI